MYNEFNKVWAKAEETDTAFVEEYSARALMDTTMEEAGELVQAISKYFRVTDREGIPTRVTEEEAMQNLKEELADVTGMCLLLMSKLNSITECGERHVRKSIKAVEK